MSEAIRTLYVNNLNERIKRDRVREELTKLCAGFGPVTAVYMNRGIRKRGQAFIAFTNRSDADAALSGLQNKLLFEKPLRVAFARSASGNQASSKRKAERTIEHSAKRRTTEPTERGTDNKEEAIGSKERSPEAEVPREKSFGKPNRRLLLQKIPEHISVEELQTICGQYEGFTGARMFAARHVGFVEFESTEAAAAAVDQISERNIGDVTFAKE